MNLIYICVFHQESYIKLLNLLITSIYEKSNINKETTDILILTSPHFKLLIEKELENVQLTLQYHLLDLNTLAEAACSRLKIFQYEFIDKYQKILYLDTDILINSDVNVLFDTEISPEKLYALEEGVIGHPYWGGDFFDFAELKKSNRSFSEPDTLAFCSGVLYFMNSSSMQKLFQDINTHIENYMSNNNSMPACLDQPFIVYHSFIQDKYDNQMMKKYVKHNLLEYDLSAITPETIIYHFSGKLGQYSFKYDKMISFWERMKNLQL